MSSVTFSGSGELTRGVVVQRIGSATSVTITGYSSIGQSAFIEEVQVTSVTISNSVTSIASSAFRDCSSLTSINIPTSVTSIGTYAFYSCTSLTSIDIPNSVTNIGTYAFQYCSSLASVTIPNGVTNIGTYTFQSCNALASVTFMGNIPIISPDNFQISGDTAYYYQGATNTTRLTDIFTTVVILIPPVQPAPEITSITTSNGTATIKFTQSLTAIITSYEYSTNGGTNWVTASAISSPITITGLTNGTTYSFTIRNYNGLYSEASNVINATMSVTATITFTGTGALTQGVVTAGIGSATSVVIERYSSISGGAFQSCSNLTSIVIPNSVTSIDIYAFYLCTGLTSITIPNSVTRIVGPAFYGCSGLTSITIPSSVLTISANAFQGCTGLTSVTTNTYLSNFSSVFPVASLNAAGLQFTFNYAGEIPACGARSNLAGVTIGSTITSIAESAFQSCSALESIVIPDSVISIGGGAFEFCSNLTSIVIPNSVTTIGASAFANCSALTSITIPSSVTSIGDWTFYGCILLVTVYLPSPNGLNITSPSTGGVNFYNVPQQVNIELTPQPAPVITTIATDTTGTAIINFTQGSTSGVNTITSYQYSTDGGTTWVNALVTSSPITITELTDGTSYNFTIRNFNGSYSAPSNVVTTSPSCYNEGTKILCLNKNLEEEYIPIENLRKGDLVKTFKHGYRKIVLIGKKSMMNNPKKFTACMYKMVKTDDNGLIEDLIVTGLHGILVNELGNYKEENDKIFGSTPMIDDKYLLLCAVSNDFIELEDTNLYTYYHLVLECDEGEDDKRFGVWANGVLSESTPKFDFIKHNYTLL